MHTVIMIVKYKTMGNGKPRIERFEFTGNVLALTQFYKKMRNVASVEVEYEV